MYDAYGDGSRQTDIVITNADHPLAFPVEKSGTYVVDGVAAAGEIKAVLDVGGLDDCIAKGTAFKQLRMTIADNDHVINAKQQAFMKQMGLVPPYFAVASTRCRTAKSASATDARSVRAAQGGERPVRVAFGEPVVPSILLTVM